MTSDDRTRPGTSRWWICGCPHKPFNVGSRIGCTVGDRHSLDSQNLSQPQVQGTAVRSSRSSWPASPELAEDPIVVMDKETGHRTERSRFPDPLFHPGQCRRCRQSQIQSTRSAGVKRNTPQSTGNIRKSTAAGRILVVAAHARNLFFVRRRHLKNPAGHAQPARSRRCPTGSACPLCGRAALCLQW